MTMACCLCQSHALGTSSRLPRPSATPSGAKPNSCVEVFPCVARFSLMSTLHSAKRRLPSVSATTCEAWAGPLRNDRNRIVIDLAPPLCGPATLRLDSGGECQQLRWPTRSCRRGRERACRQGKLEARAGFDPAVEVAQTSAFPLG